jgi:hypothetical protein
MLGEEYQGRPRSLEVIVAGANFDSRRPRIDCDDFSPMIPEQFRKDLQAAFDAYSESMSNEVIVTDEIS